jgi:predicted DNA repair protein MutK
MTVGVYGLVAGIVKLDDAGLHLSMLKGASAARILLRGLGRALLAAAPWLMKSLSVIGTAAMFMVGGGILVHGVPGGEEFVHKLSERTHGVPGIGGVLAAIGPTLLNALIGVIAGALALLGVSAGTRAYRAAKGN